MPSPSLRQAARTPRLPYPANTFADGSLRGTLDRIPYAYAIEIREYPVAFTAFENDVERVVKIRCPWCGHAEEIRGALLAEPLVDCERFQGRYVVAIPAGTPILVPAA